MARDFAGDIAALKPLLAKDRWSAVPRFRQLHEEWARSLLGLSPDPEDELVSLVRGAVERDVTPELAKDAAAQLLEAENYQWEIGTWSTGSGEGLASMYEVRTLELARAWLLAKSDPAKAFELIAAVEGDANNIARRLEPHWVALKSRIATR